MPAGRDEVSLLVDTSVIWGFRKGDLANPEFYRNEIEGKRLFVSFTVFGELRDLLHKEGCGDDEAAREMQKMLPDAGFLPFTATTRDKHDIILASYRHQITSKRRLNDFWIAASADEHDLALLTSDADFLRIQQGYERLKVITDRTLG